MEAGKELTPYKILIRENHLDYLGHVNHAAYLQIYEEARWEQLVARGYSFDQMNESGIGPIILEVNVKYLKEILLRETITIHTQLHAIKAGKIAELHQKMVKDDGTIASYATIVMCLLDLKKRKMVPINHQWKILFNI
jgi:YbgC/YbaW family acyl-CoA thioester hydrolase